MDKPLVSIIIPIRDRSVLLRRCLERLSAYLNVKILTKYAYDV